MWGVMFPHQAIDGTKNCDLRAGANFGMRADGFTERRPAIGLASASGRAFQLARRRAGCDRAPHADFTDIDALVEFRCVIPGVALRNALTLLVGIARLLLRARGHAQGSYCRDNEARQPQGFPLHVYYQPSALSALRQR
jgi:hypothetical protein